MVTGSIPGWRTMIPHAMQHRQSQKIKRKRIKKNVIYVKYNHIVNFILKSRFFQNYEINDNELSSLFISEELGAQTAERFPQALQTWSSHLKS